MAQPTRSERRPRTECEQEAYEEGLADRSIPWLWILGSFVLGVLFGLWPVEAIYTLAFVVGLAVLLLRLSWR